MEEAIQYILYAINEKDLDYYHVANSLYMPQFNTSFMPVNINPNFTMYFLPCSYFTFIYKSVKDMIPHYDDFDVLVKDIENQDLKTPYISPDILTIENLQKFITEDFISKKRRYFLWISACAMYKIPCSIFSNIFEKSDTELIKLFPHYDNIDDLTNDLFYSHLKYDYISPKILNEQSTILYYNKPRKQTALYVACRQGHLDHVKWIFSHETENLKVDVNKTECNGSTALHATCFFVAEEKDRRIKQNNRKDEYFEILEMMLEQPGIDISIRNRYNNTPYDELSNCLPYDTERRNKILEKFGQNTNEN